MTRLDAGPGTWEGQPTTNALRKPSCPPPRPLITQCDIMYQSPETAASKVNLHVRSSIPRTLVFFLQRRHNPHAFQLELSSSFLAHTSLLDYPVDGGIRRVDIAFLSDFQPQYEALKRQGCFAFEGVYYKAVVPVPFSAKSNLPLKLFLQYIPPHFSGTDFLALFGPYGTVLEAGRYYNPCGGRGGKKTVRAYTGSGYVLLQRPSSQDAPPHEDIPTSFDTGLHIRLQVRVVQPRPSEGQLPRQDHVKKYPHHQRYQRSFFPRTGGHRQRNIGGKQMRQSSFAIEGAGPARTISNPSGKVATTASIPPMTTFKVVASDRVQKKEKEDYEEEISEYEDALETLPEINPLTFSALTTTMKISDRGRRQQERPESEKDPVGKRLPEIEYPIPSPPLEQHDTPTSTTFTAREAAVTLVAATKAIVTTAAALVIAVLAGVVAAVGAFIWVVTVAPRCLNTAAARAFRGKAKVIENWHDRDASSYGLLGQTLLLLCVMAGFICFCFLFSFTAVFAFLTGFSEITFELTP